MVESTLRDLQRLPARILPISLQALPSLQRPLPHLLHRQLRRCISPPLRVILLPPGLGVCLRLFRIITQTLPPRLIQIRKQHLRHAVGMTKRHSVGSHPSDLALVINLTRPSRQRSHPLALHLGRVRSIRSQQSPRHHADGPEIS